MKSVLFSPTKYARAATFFIAALALLGLSACSTTQLVNSRVTSFSKLDPATTTTLAGSFRFERLPSQSAHPATTPDASYQDKLEAWTAHELSALGLKQQAFGNTPAPAAPWTVQINAQVRRYWRGAEVAPGMLGAPAMLGSAMTYYPAPMLMNTHVGIGFGGYRGHWGPGWGFGMGYRFGYPYPYYDQGSYLFEVSILMRDAKDGRVVYETKALHETRYGNSDIIYPAMIKAALNGFPQAPQGPRHISIDVTPKPAS